MAPETGGAATRRWWEREGAPLLQPLTGAASKLPYSIVPDAEALLVRYLTQFTEALALRNLPSLAQAIDNLDELHSLKVRLEAPALVELVKILLGLITAQDLVPPWIATKAANFLFSILKKNQTRLDGTLVIDHRPLVARVDLLLFGPRRLPPSLAEIDSAPMFVKVCKKARRHFAAEATDDLLAMIQDDIDPLRRDRMARALCLLAIFMPSTDAGLQRLVPLLRAHSPFWASNCKRFEGILFYLLSRCAKHCSNRDMTADLPFYYGILVRHLKLPAPEDNVQRPEKILYHTKTSVNIVKGQLRGPTSAFSSFVAYSCAANESLLDGLAGYLASLDSFCHPANHGRWAKEILDLLSDLTLSFARIVSLREDLFSESSLLKLGPILWRPISNLMFSRHSTTALHAQGIIKHLSYIFPDYIQKRALELAATSLSSYCEPLRVNACIGMLSQLVCTEFSSTPSNEFLVMLSDCVSALEISDSTRMNVVVNLLIKVLMQLPPGPVVEQSIISVAYFEEIAIEILSRVISIIEKSSRNLENQGYFGDAAESHAPLLKRLLRALFSRMSFDLWKFALGKVEALVVSGSGSFSMVRNLVDASKGCYPDVAINRLLPKLKKEITSRITEGTGTDIKQSDRQCGALLWFLECFLGLCRFSRGALVAHAEDVQDLCSTMATLRQRTCVILAGKIVKATIRSLSDQYLINWSPTEGTMTTRSNILTLEEIKVKWHVPGPDCTRMAQSICSLFKARTFGEAHHGEDSLRAKLVFSHALVKAECIMNGAPSRLEESEVLSFALEIAHDASLAIETRQLALELLNTASEYFAYSYRAVQAARLASYAQVRQAERFKREKSLPYSIQAERCMVAHKRWKYYSLKSRRRGSSSLEESLLTIALDPHGILRKLSQDVLANELCINPSRIAAFARILQSEDVDRAAEGRVRGLCHMLRSDPFSGFLFSTLDNALVAIEFAGRLQQSDAVLKSPIASDLFGLVMPSICRLHPLPSSPAPHHCQEIEALLRRRLDPQESGLACPELLQKALQLARSHGLGWKMEVVMSMFVSILSEGCHDCSTLGPVIDLFLDLMTSDVAQSRSLAVNRGVAPLYRYMKVINGLASDVDEHDRTSKGCAPLQLQGGTDGLSAAIINYLQQGLKWIFQDGGHPNGHVNFRSDCAELMQTLTELVGFRLFEEIIAVVQKLPVETSSPAYQRAMAEIMAGVCRGLAFYDLEEEQSSRVAKEVVRSMSFAGSSSSQVWFDSAFFMVDSFDECRLLSIFEIIVTRMAETMDSPEMSTITLCIQLSFMAGYLRGCPDSAFVERMFPRTHGLMASHLDGVRRAASNVLFVMLSSRPAYAQHVQWSHSGADIHYKKSLLVLAEKQSQDPVRTGFWDHAVDIVFSLISMIGTGDDVEMQVEARRILQVLAWTGFAPRERSKELLTRCLDTDDPRFGGMPEGAIKALLKFARTFYGRNHLLFQGSAGQLVDQVVASMGRERVSTASREDFAEVLGLIFHANDVLCSTVSEKIHRQLEQAVRGIKEPETIRERHCLVLVASSLVLSHPYDVPDWVPGLLALLTRFIHDRHPIGAAARRTFGEFKRTHGGRWEEHREKFTEDQLDAISELLVAPAYYA